METRHPVYAEADITVESRDAQHSDTVQDVVRSLAEWGQNKMRKDSEQQENA
jgi:hypothetical protein